MPETSDSAHGVALIAARYELIREVRSTDATLQWEAFDLALERRVIVEFPSGADAEKGFWQQARAAARANTVAGERVLDAGTDPETGRIFIVREWPQHEVRTVVAEPAAAPARRRNRGRLALIGGVLAIGLAVAALRPGVDGWLAWVNAPLGNLSGQFVLGPVPTAARQSPIVGDTVAPTVASRASTPTAAATPRATATAAPAGGVQRRVVNTDGRGVALRASPGGDRLPGKGYDEGAIVTALESSGEWTHIRGGDGREGWVLSVTLRPA